MHRTIIFIVIMALWFQFECVAQPLKLWGFKFGISSASQQFQDVDTYKPTVRQTGFDAAVFTEWPSSSLFSLVTQLEFIQRGTVIDVSPLADFGNPISYTDDHNRLQYLSALILGKFSIARQSAIPYILIGPHADYLLGYASDYHLLDFTYSHFKKIIWGITAGVGCYSGSLLPVTLIGEIRYNFDILNSATLYNKIRNESIDFWLGCAF